MLIKKFVFTLFYYYFQYLHQKINTVKKSRRDITILPNFLKLANLVKIIRCSTSVEKFFLKE